MQPETDNHIILQPMRTIVHLDLDSFFVSAERLRNPKLNGKPVIIGGMSDRGVVASCSYEARTYGVHSAMPMRMARQLCKDAFFIRGDMETYSKYSDIVTDIIAERAPVYEKASIDEHYLDLTGMDRFFGCLQWSKELRQTIIKETGLPISFGLSVNKTVSKIATGEAKPNGGLQIEAPVVQPFLNPLPISKIPGVGQKTYKLLTSMGVERIETLKEIPPFMMQNVLGKAGIELWKKANGIDNSPVIRFSERKSISAETTFDHDTADMRYLEELIVHMVEKLAFELRQKQKLTGNISVKIKYSDFDTHTIQKHITYTSFDHILINEAKELLHRLYTRRMMIRLIGIKLSRLITGAQQLNLFENTPEQISLYMAMDKIRHKFGSHVIRRAAGIKWNSI
ncbi:MAG: DNA polymerase IV [Chlorobi bacterium]|nr:DNA polymerase IV [Chlorobiota bacterium]